MLIIAPLNPAYMTWPEEIKGWTNFRRFKIAMLHGRLKEAAWNTNADIYITTPDSLPWILQKLKGKPRKNWPFDVLGVDESGRFKTYNSSRSKNIKKIVPGFKCRYILNGTPVGNGYMGLMSQMAIVDQGQSLGQTIGEYRSKYFKQEGRPEWNQYTLLEGADNRIMRRISKFCVCMRAEDHVEMPNVIEMERFIRLPKKAQDYYDEMESELFTLIDEKELVAESSSSLSTKLHQLCNGSIYEDQDPLGEPLPPSKRNIIEVHKEKINALEDLIEEFNGKQILIGYKFKHDKVALKKHFGKAIKFFDEAPNPQAKVKLQTDWNNGKIQLLAGNPKSVAHGLNLQKGAAHVIAMYSIDHDYEDFDQFVRRLRRRGNEAGSIYIAYILARGLYDHMVIYPNLQGKGKGQNRFFDYLINYRNQRRVKK